MQDGRKKVRYLAGKSTWRSSNCLESCCKSSKHVRHSQPSRSLCPDTTTTVLPTRQVPSLGSTRCSRHSLPRSTSCCKGLRSFHRKHCRCLFFVRLDSRGLCSREHTKNPLDSLAVKIDRIAPQQIKQGGPEKWCSPNPEIKISYLST